MIVEIDGVEYDVPDDATPEEIGKLTASAPVPAAPAPQSGGVKGALGTLAKNALTTPVGLAEVAASLGSNAALYPLALAADAGEQLSPWPSGGSEARMPPPGHTRAPDYGEEEYQRQNELAEDRDDRARGDREARGVMSLGYQPKTEAGQRLASGLGDLFKYTLGRFGSGAGELASNVAGKLGAEAPEQAEVGRTAEEAANAIATAALPGVIGRGRAALSGRRVNATAPVPADFPASPDVIPAPEAAAASEAVVTPSRMSVSDRLFRVPKPIPEAKFLKDRGVRITKGMNDPSSAYSQVEIASTSKGGTGALIRKQRQTALEDAMDLGFSEAAPPGVNLSAELKAAGRDINAKYEVLKNAWDESFNAIRAKGEAIYPALHNGKGGVPLASTANRPGLLTQIIRDKGVDWDPASRARAASFVENQIGRLPEVKGALGKVDLGSVLKVSSEIKKAYRKALRNQEYDLAEIYDRVGDAVDAAVESQASPATSAELKALRSKYRDFKIMEDAVIRTGDSPGGVSPARLSSSVRAADSLRSDYAAGGGGSLRDLSKAVARVFDESASPATGARLLTAAPGWLNDLVVGPTIYLKNSAAARSSPMTRAISPELRQVLEAAQVGGTQNPNLSRVLADLAPFIPGAATELGAPGSTRFPLGVPAVAADEDEDR